MAEVLIPMNEDDDEDYLSYLKSLSPEGLHSAVTDKVGESKYEILNAGAVADAMAVTNASDWDVDEYEISDIHIGADEVRASVSFRLTGEQDQDKPWSGSAIKGEATVVIDSAGKVSFEDVSAEADDELDEGDE